MGLLEYLGGVAKIMGGAAGAAFLWILAVAAWMGDFAIIATAAVVIGFIVFLYAVYSRRELDKQAATQ